MFAGSFDLSAEVGKLGTQAMLLITSSRCTFPEFGCWLYAALQIFMASGCASLAWACKAVDLSLHTLEMSSDTQCTSSRFYMLQRGSANSCEL